MKIKKQDTYQNLLFQIKQSYVEGQLNAIKMVRRQLVLTYWSIGQHIVDFEQLGNEKAVYGSHLLETLSKDLSVKLGKGFSRTNLIYMRLCFIKYPNINDLSDQLTWGHLVELLSIEHELERNFYQKQTVIEHWTIRELKRQYL
jgi:hypothetical protein